MTVTLSSDLSRLAKPPIGECRLFPWRAMAVTGNLTPSCRSADDGSLHYVAKGRADFRQPRDWISE